jgi:peptidyl-prolyl cis-trans isomerase C
MQPTVSAFALAALIVAADCIAQAQRPGDEVLAENGYVKLTRSDYETDLLRVPPEMRGDFAASPKRLTTMLNTLLLNKTLAKEARDTGLDRDDEIARRLALETERFLAQAMIGKIENAAAAEFDAREAEFLPTARETYMLNKQKYRRPEQISASHILFDPAKRGNDAALALANETRAKLRAGANFATLAAELSDDPTAKTNGGALGWFGPNKMDPAFYKAAVALKEPGDLSEPVQSAFGWHIIRLDGRRPPQDMPWEQARKLIMEDLKQRYINDARDKKLNAIRNDPQLKVNQAAIDALVVKLPDAPRQPGPRPSETK